MTIPTNDETVAALSDEIVAIASRFHARGWVLGTSGNFSAIVSREPLRLAMSASSIPKGRMHADDILVVDEEGMAVGSPSGTPSAEALLHVEIVRRTGAGAVLHTHSAWATALTDTVGRDRAIEIEGYEMLKGLAGVTTHEHTELLPVIENDQEMVRLARVVGRTLQERPAAHGFLLRRHGLYTWGATLADAERHVEILEFLLEVVGRSRLLLAR